MLILTHNDMDGWLAGAIALRAHPGAEVRCVQYGTPCPIKDARGRAVCVLDFSWPADQMAELAAAALDLVWIDHHPGPIEAMIGQRLERAEVRLCADRCGAYLAWEFFERLHRPWIVDLVDDHDRWVHAIDDTRPAMAALHALVGQSGPTWAGWSTYMGEGPIDEPPTPVRDHLVGQGQVLLLDRAARVRKAARQAIPVMLDGHSAMMVNAPPDIASDLGAALCEQPGVTIGWIWSVGLQGGQPRVFHSLRSGSDGPDVGEICKRRGGGGHPHAAGWSRPLDVETWMPEGWWDLTVPIVADMETVWGEKEEK